MLVVKLELHSPRTGSVKTLGTMVITNRGDSDDPRVGNYRVRVMRGPRFTSILKDTGVDSYRRLSRPVWDLVALALHRAGYGKGSGRLRRESVNQDDAP